MVTPARRAGPQAKLGHYQKEGWGEGAGLSESDTRREADWWGELGRRRGLGGGESGISL